MYARSQPPDLLFSNGLKFWNRLVFPVTKLNIFLKIFFFNFPIFEFDFVIFSKCKQKYKTKFENRKVENFHFQKKFSFVTGNTRRFQNFNPFGKRMSGGWDLAYTTYCLFAMFHVSGLQSDQNGIPRINTKSPSLNTPPK